MYRVRNFLFRLKRGLSWFVFSFKQQPFQEDQQLFEVIEKVLLDTANYFEQKSHKSEVYSITNKEDIEDMKLAAKLIRMRIQQHYWHSYIEKQRNPKWVDSGDIFKAGEFGFYKPTHSFEDERSEEEKDDKALRIAMKIIAEKGFHWWI